MYRVFRHHRVQLSTALAVLGVLAYALLLPGHLTSQFRAQLGLSDAGIFAESMCRSDGSGSADHGTPQSNCPICKSLASYQLALAAPAPVALPLMPHARPAPTQLFVAIAVGILHAPRSRGPPTSA